MHICLEGLIYDSDHTLEGLLAKSGDHGLNPILAQFYTHHQSQIPDELLFFIFKHWHKVDSDSRTGFVEFYETFLNIFSYCEILAIVVI